MLALRRLFVSVVVVSVVLSELLELLLLYRCCFLADWLCRVLHVYIYNIYFVFL